MKTATAQNHSNDDPLLGRALQNHWLGPGPRPQAAPRLHRLPCSPMSAGCTERYRPPSAETATRTSPVA